MAGSPVVDIPEDFGGADGMRLLLLGGGGADLFGDEESQLCLIVDVSSLLKVYRLCDGYQRGE